MAGMPTNVLDGAGLRVARCDFDGDFDNPQARANATLIAAAPDLYALLSRAVNAAWGDYSWVDEARAAIARASGESQ